MCGGQIPIIYDIHMTLVSLTSFLRNQMFLIKTDVKRIRSDFIVFGERALTVRITNEGTYNVIFRVNYEFYSENLLMFSLF